MLKALWDRFCCAVAECHWPVQVWEGDSLVPTRVECRYCGRELHHTHGGHWYCHASQWSSAVFALVGLLILLMFFTGVAAFHVHLFQSP